MRVVVIFVLLTVFVGFVAPLGPIPVGAQSKQEAGIRQHSVKKGETGGAWLEDVFGGLYSIESILINPPDTAFKERDRHLLVKILNSDNQWTTVIDMPVNADAALDSEIWPRISLGPKLTPEMVAFYNRLKRTPPSPDTYGYRLEAVFQPQEPLPARGVRFEMVGPYAMGKAWTFWVKTDSLPARYGGVSREWRYRHVW